MLVYDGIPYVGLDGIYISISQFVCIGRVCSSYDQFCEHHYKLIERLIKQGFRYLELFTAFKKFARSHADIFNKYMAAACGSTSRMEYVYQCVMRSLVAMSPHVASRSTRQ